MTAKLIVKHRVADYDAWYRVFTDHQDNRQSHGCTGHTVLRDAGDADEVTVITFWPDVKNAQAFAEDPSLREAMANAGVDGPPRLEFGDVTEESSY